jgi:hypothetical protein
MRAIVNADSLRWALHLHLSRGLAYNKLEWPSESGK